MNRPTEQEETAAASAGDQAGQLRASLIRKHPRMVYGNPDDFFLELLMEEQEES